MRSRRWWSAGSIAKLLLCGAYAGCTGQAPTLPEEDTRTFATEPFDAGSESDRNRVEPGRVCERLAAIQCAGEAACCESRRRSVGECIEEMERGCDRELYLDDISRNDVAGYSVEAAEEAFSELERLASACDPGIASWAVSPSGLRGVVRGTIEGGGDCTPPSILNRPEAAGYIAACLDAETTACLPALDGSDWICSPRGSVGRKCFIDINCEEGLYCDNPRLGPPSSKTVCKERKAIGAPCELSNECESLACRNGGCVVSDSQTAYCLED